MENTGKDNFKDKVLSSDLPVLVYFYSDLQAPCLLVDIPLEKLEAAYAGRVAFFKVDVLKETELCGKYSVLSVPRMILFRQGEVAASRMGSASYSVLESFIKAYI